MSRKRKNKLAGTGNPASENATRKEQFWNGYNLVEGHPIFSPLMYRARIIHEYVPENLCPAGGMAVVSRDGHIHVNINRSLQPPEWAYVLAHCLLHLAFGHFKEQHWSRLREWNAACDCYVARFLHELKFGSLPSRMKNALHELNIAGFSIRDEERLFEEFCIRGIPENLLPVGTAGNAIGDMHLQATRQAGLKVDWQECFSYGLQSAVSTTVQQAGLDGPDYEGFSPSKQWFISNFPLLGALASTFKILEDREVCNRLKIRVAAVDMAERIIYINPTVGLNQQEMRFVMAHELLHVGLRHDIRCRGRDPYLWNVACDYVINAWLVEMGVGHMPAIGALYDPSLKGESAEAIYDRITKNLRYYRKLLTMRGYGASDIIGGLSGVAKGDGTDLDDFYRRCLHDGLQLHEMQGRGYLPAGLVEEIRALSQPPVPWDVELAQWFEYHFRPLEKVRSYTRLSRRQSSTPEIPRPSLVAPQIESEGRTFGVLLDTSGSMDSRLLAKALGAIASYSMAHDVPGARVVFCDAVTYDQGYMPPEQIAERVKVRGRGGTVLQPGIDLLEYADDFPKDGPILIITDGLCDRLHIRREHAFLLPAKNSLPFTPRGPVFRIS